ncbi:hypothetical protein FBU30_007156 [Linnemannia zychae]|nr:hypothetical protein FBU30_007156 [Linnemannia zychae]
MKISNFLSTALAITLAYGVHAGPATSTDDSALFASVTDYDYHTANQIIGHYNKAVYSNSTPLFHSNAATKATPSKDIIPFCVAIASNPTRTRVVRNKQICDGDGWKTLFVFTAHTKKDKHHAAYPVCIGSASNPNRSIIRTLKDNCSDGGWKHESVLYFSGRINGESEVSLTHESTEIWRSIKGLDRMIFYPYYKGDKQNWEKPRYLGYRTRWRLATSREMDYLKADLSNHEQINKKITITSPPDVTTHRCAQNLIQFVPAVLIDASKVSILQGKDISKYVDWAARDECSKLVSSSQIQTARVTKNGFTSIEVIINKKVYAAVSLRANVVTPEYYIHLALQESMRTGVSIPVTVDKNQPDQIVALVAGTIATFGGSTTFTYPIPKA